MENKKTLKKVINYLVTSLYPAFTIKGYIRKAKARGITDVSIDVNVSNDMPESYHIELYPSLSPSWPSSVVESGGRRGLSGKRIGLERAILIEEKLRKEGINAVVEQTIEFVRDSGNI